MLNQLQGRIVVLCACIGISQIWYRVANPCIKKAKNMFVFLIFLTFFYLPFLFPPLCRQAHADEPGSLHAERKERLRPGAAHHEGRQLRSLRQAYATRRRTNHLRDRGRAKTDLDCVPTHEWCPFAVVFKLRGAPLQRESIRDTAWGEMDGCMRVF